MNRKSLALLSTLAGLLLTVSCMLLFIGAQGGPAWVNWAGGLGLSALLLMPALLLLVQRDLVAPWMDTLLHLLTWRPLHKRFGPSAPADPWKPWNQLGAQEQVSIIMLALLCLLGGVLVLLFTLNQMM
ncbi:MAG: hypothetical protein JXA37_01940 [Chloroflexia bacterium]|nr:hypothetical protein [Chloroflexia bacterium]